MPAGRRAAPWGRARVSPAPNPPERKAQRENLEAIAQRGRRSPGGSASPLLGCGATPPLSRTKKTTRRLFPRPPLRPLPTRAHIVRIATGDALAGKAVGLEECHGPELTCFATGRTPPMEASRPSNGDGIAHNTFCTKDHPCERKLMHDSSHSCQQKPKGSVQHILKVQPYQQKQRPRASGEPPTSAWAAHKFVTPAGASRAGPGPEPLAAHKSVAAAGAPFGRRSEVQNDGVGGCGVVPFDRPAE